MTTIERKKGGRPTKRPSNEKLNEMYQSMTARQIGMKYNVSENTVRSWIYRARRKAELNGSTTE